MRAAGYRKPLPITDPEALIDIDLPDPTPNPRDLLVRIKAVSVNHRETRFNAGSIARQGTDAKFRVVDERIVGRKPAS